jgi:hypothetical protein
MRGGGLIRDDDRRGARDRNDFAARDAFGRTFLRRTAQHGKEQQRQKQVDQERPQEAPGQTLRISAILRIALEFHAMR